LVADQQAADAEVAGAASLGEAGGHGGVAAGATADRGGDPRLRTDVPRGARAEEEVHLDVALGAEPGHLPDLVVAEHHHAAALGDPVHRHAELVRRREHGLEDSRPLAARDLDAPAGAVGEAGPGGDGRLDDLVAQGAEQFDVVHAGTSTSAVPYVDRVPSALSTHRSPSYPQPTPPHRPAASARRGSPASGLPSWAG
jgi:hypothetical protein